MVELLSRTIHEFYLSIGLMIDTATEWLDLKNDYLETYDFFIISNLYIPWAKWDKWATHDSIL